MCLEPGIPELKTSTLKPIGRTAFQLGFESDVVESFIQVLSIGILNRDPFLESSETLRAILRVSQFPLYLKNGEDLSRQTSQLFFFLLS